MTAGAYTAKIAGSLVNVVAGSLNIVNQIGQRSQGGLTVWSALGVTWQYGTQIQVYDDTNALAYAGYITKDKAYRDPGARQGDGGLLLHDLTLMDNCYRADKRRVFKSYLNVTAGFIVNDLLGAYLAPEGVTALPTSIATGLTINEVIWNGTKSVSDALTWLAEQAGYWWQIDLNAVLWFQPYGGVPAPFTLDGTNADSMQDLYVENGNDLYVNREYAKGSFAETSVLTESFHGNSLTRNYTLSYEVSTVASVALNGVDVTALSLTKGSSGGLFYYAVGDAVIAQDPSFPLLAVGDTLVITYKGRYPVLAVAQNTALIAAQKAREGVGTGLVESIYSSTKVRTLAAAFQIASALLSHYGSDSTLLTFSTRSKGLQPGQMLNVNLSDFGLSNKQMLINSVGISDQNDGINIWYPVQAIGSPVESAQWQTYWQNLMQQSSDPSDYTDTTDTSLALLSVSSFTASHSFAVTQAKHTCPIFSNATTFGNSTVFC